MELDLEDLGVGHLMTGEKICKFRVVGYLCVSYPMTNDQTPSYKETGCKRVYFNVPETNKKVLLSYYLKCQITF